MPTGLGRGLGSLIPQKKPLIFNPAVNNERMVIDPHDQILHVVPEKISVNPFQPRHNFSESAIEELKASIKEHGIIQPLIVTQKEDGFELIAGERRLRSAMALQLKTVPVIVRDANRQKKMEIALIENLQREDLNPIETAIAYKRLMEEFNIGQDEVARRVSKARPSITNSLRLLNLPEEIQKALSEGLISEGHAKYLLGLDSEKKQLEVFRKITQYNLSVAETSKTIKHIGGTKAARIKENYADHEREERLRQFFGNKVEIKRKGKGGEIVISFFDDEALSEILSKIG
ncbi:MAG: ParB/RepB/Spo0J family partition protein [Planctomycetes bacterium]|jgi:ParB family chromosome partitioning protein|nr:ParB/RepB/Spo0J family partition protein [Planctomycetota bacterium]